MNRRIDRSRYDVIIRNDFYQREKVPLKFVEDNFEN